MNEEKRILQEYPFLYDMCYRDYDNNLIKDNIWQDCRTI